MFKKRSTGAIDVWNDYPNKKDLTREEFSLILATFHNTMMREIISTGDTYILPKSTGRIGVQRIKPKKRLYFIDFAHLRKTGEKTYHSNLHSHGYFVKWIWLKKFPFSRIPREDLFKFRAVESQRKALAREVKQNNSIMKYYERAY